MFHFIPSKIVASYTDILRARHAIFLRRLRDEPKECLRRRLVAIMSTIKFLGVHIDQKTGNIILRDFEKIEAGMRDKHL